MNDTVGESIGAALAASLAFLGALGAAMKFWPKKETEKRDDMNAVLQRVTALETRANVVDKSIETSRGEIRADFGKVFDQLGDLGEAIARIESALGIQRGSRF